jgi:hypothetical protein
MVAVLNSEIHGGAYAGRINQGTYGRSRERGAGAIRWAWQLSRLFAALIARYTMTALLQAVSAA